MKQTRHIEICGKGVALNYSLSAVEEIEKLMGGECDNVIKFIYSEDGMANLDRIVKVAEILMREGAAYERIVSGKETRTFKAEELKVLLSVKEAVDLRNEISLTIIESSERNVETEIEKNAEATQTTEN